MTPEEIEEVRRQIGREPRGAINIETWCPKGHPQVVRVYPLLRRSVDSPKSAPILPRDYEFFPTLFWLTCPDLCRKVSLLEAKGWIDRFEQEIDDDPALQQSYREDHESYSRERWDLLTEEDREVITALGWKDRVMRRGIGGLFHLHTVKCLHLHLAHHLARGSVLGSRLVERSSLDPCPSSACSGGSTSERILP